ncbi:uncharacterized protein [Procambarus clarkii]|uniref:uncharacterized protein n=1 Tax=Procambarus clarkii TaxID=6728 RepID=UPI003742C4D4
MPLSSLFANRGLWVLPLRTFALLLSQVVCKLFERMVNVRLMWFLEHHHLLSPSQFGFRKCRSTTDVLVNLEVYIRTAFAAKTSVVAVLFDLEKAYDTTWRYHILSQLHSFGLRGHLPLFLRSFLSRRSFRVRLGTALSPSFQQYEGVTQGSVLSTTLFLVALNGLLSSLPSGVFSALYVDDLTLCCQGDDSPLLQRRLQLAIDSVSSWAKGHGFKFSTSKTCAMTFTRKRVVLRPSLSLYGHPLEYKDSAKLLGLFLDTRLSWSPHISYLRVECSKALTLLRVLSHTSWGADRRTLLALHSSLVLSKLDYGCPAYSSASPSTLRRLDALHHTGLRLSSGAFRSTPVLSLYVDTGFLSLQDRRDRYCLRYLARSLQHPSSRLCRALTFTPPAVPVPLHHLPLSVRLSRLQDSLSVRISDVSPRVVPSLPPWRVPLSRFCTSLTRITKAFTPPTVLKRLFLEHFSSHSRSVSVFTDGSKSADGVGYSVVFPDRTYMCRLPPETSIFTAELYAILYALRLLLSRCQSSFVVVVDSRSALMALGCFNPVHPVVVEIQHWLFLVHSKFKSVEFCWVPSHIGVSLNERADAAAKEAVRSCPISRKGIRYSDFYPVIHSSVLTRWQASWLSVTGNKLRTLKCCVSSWPSSFLRNRRWETALARLHIGHTRLTHGHLMERRPAPYCPSCIVPLTVVHVLLECPDFQDERVSCFPTAPRGHLSLDRILGDSDTFDIVRLMRFCSRIGILGDI